jgi:hypothetical protein
MEVETRSIWVEPWAGCCSALLLLRRVITAMKEVMTHDPPPAIGCPPVAVPRTLPPQRFVIVPELKIYNAARNSGLDVENQLA